MSDQPLQFHPEHRAMLEEHALLREELAHLLAEEHDLVHLVRPNLLALYQQKIGAWELRALNSQVAVLRARRRLEMARAAVNQGRKPDINEIDGHLELEFLSWQRKIQETAQRIAHAEHRLANLRPEAEARELKKLYYSLVKKLHPDLNANLSGDQRRLWLRVQRAHELSDLEELRALSLLIDQPGGEAACMGSIETLRRETETLRAQIATMLKRIETLESQPPFTLRSQLKDEAWVAQRRQKIEAEIAQFDEQRAALESQLQTILTVIDHGRLFGLN